MSDKEKNLEHARSLVEAGKNDEARMCLLELLKQDQNKAKVVLTELSAKYPEDALIIFHLQRL